MSIRNMDIDINSVPSPRPLSIMLVCFGWFFHWLSVSFNHTTINAWLATMATSAAIISYSITFAKWCHKTWKLKHKK